MKRTKDTNKGITLIALVITIIVMLILVAVTITMAVNGGLFEYAGRAGSETNAARDAEQEFANVDSDMTYDDLIDKYTGWEENGTQGGNEGEKPEETKQINFSINGVTYNAYEDETWESWINRTGNPDYGFYISKFHDDYIIYKLDDTVHDENDSFVSPAATIRERL